MDLVEECFVLPEEDMERAFELTFQQMGDAIWEVMAKRIQVLAAQVQEYEGTLLSCLGIVTASLV